MRLIGYTRVSTEEQARTGVSLDQQGDTLSRYCGLHDHVLAGVLRDEGVSASTPLARRQAGRELLRLLRAGEVDGVLVTRLDRLFRNALDGLEFFHRTAKRFDFSVISVTELVDSSTPHGRLNLTIQLAAAQFERDMAVQRASETNLSLCEQGRVYGGIPYGCVKVGEDRLARDPETWERREYIVAMLERGTSLRKTAAALEAEGIPSPRGCKRWGIDRLRSLRDRHESLSHLPFADQCASADGPTPEAEASCPS